MTMLVRNLKSLLTKKHWEMKDELEIKAKNITVNGRKTGCSGFLTDRRSGACVYFTSEECCNPNLTYMFRYARDEEDFTGEQNMFSEKPLALVDDMVLALVARSHRKGIITSYDIRRGIEGKRIRVTDRDDTFCTGLHCEIFDDYTLDKVNSFYFTDSTRSLDEYWAAIRGNVPVMIGDILDSLDDIRGFDQDEYYWTGLALCPKTHYTVARGTVKLPAGFLPAQEEKEEKTEESEGR